MTEEPHRPEETPMMPRWVPGAIGVVLVAMAALAVYTGLRYRTPSLANGIVKSRRPARAMTGGAGPPGEPEPGASLVFPGDSADNAPAAHDAVTGRARAEITGTGHGITSVVRIWARRGMMTNVIPDDAMVSVNDLVIGQAKQFDKPDEIYDFPAPGSYTIHISAPGYKDQQFIVTVADDAKEEIARLDVKLIKG
ncbi:MAG: hypothetical protein JO093_02165 [Acidobacteria bacterium]|nr:hypothetical protein [Acidobacteriota bacterium]MBV9069770.1 hypothetical protein [Acidobacteriota bacterium]MBV9184389.1 hypothetical protein [Acidobacteriota bacterium]